MTAAKTFTDAERKVTLIGVMIVFLLSALDQTIVSTAMPVIMTQLNGLSLYTWVTTAYLLSSTVMIPIWGKLGDLFGRKAVLVWGIGLFLGGSWLAGISGEFGDLPVLGGGMTQLIAFRAIQGLGGGALFTTAFAIIADLFPPRERGKFAGVFGATFGLSSAIGPLLGGYFTQHGTVTLLGHVIAGWRWVFYLNLPIGLVALFMVIAKMPTLNHASRGKIDFAGAALIITAAVPLLLALTWGNDHGWTSPLVVAMFAVFAVSTVAFILVERAAADPMIHLELFGNRVFAWGNVAGFFSSMSFLSVVAFLPLYMQAGQGMSATTSGLSTLPLMIGLIGAATISGRLVSRTGLYKPFMVGGVFVVALATFLLSQLGSHAGVFDLAWRMLLLGMGLGPLQSLFGVAIQNAVEPRQIGVVTSANQFFRQIGSTVGLALFGAVLNVTLKAKGLDLTQLQTLAASASARKGSIDLPAAARIGISDGVTHVIFLSLGVVLIALVATVMIPALPLRDGRGKPTKPDAEIIPPEAHL